MNFFSKSYKYFLNESLAEYYLQKLCLKSNKTKLQKKIHSCITLDSDKGPKEIFKTLKWEFKTTTFKASDITYRNIERLSVLIYQSNNSGIKKDGYELVINDFLSLSSNSLSVNDWDKLGFICNANGLFKLSGLFRKKATDFVIERYKKKRTIKSLIAMFRVYLDLGNYGQAEKVIEQIKSKNSSNYVSNLYTSFYNYQNNKKDKDTHSDNIKNTFSELIKNKKIAVVAPGLVEIDESVVNDINSYDLIILFNYKGNKMDERFSLPFISYYNSEGGVILKDSFKNFSNDLAFSVFKKISQPYQHELNNKGRAKQVDRDLNEYFFVPQPNLLQIVLDDILIYSPQKIKVFGSNFYLNKNKYYKGYIYSGRSEEKSSDMWRAFAYHNILSQINYVRNMYNINAIELDKACLDAINMSEDELLDTYESIYSNFK